MLRNPLRMPSTLWPLQTGPPPASANSANLHLPLSRLSDGYQPDGHGHRRGIHSPIPPRRPASRLSEGPHLRLSESEAAASTIDRQRAMLSWQPECARTPGTITFARSGIVSFPSASLPTQPLGDDPNRPDPKVGPHDLRRCPPPLERPSTPMPRLARPRQGLLARCRPRHPRPWTGRGNEPAHTQSGAIRPRSDEVTPKTGLICGRMASCPPSNPHISFVAWAQSNHDLQPDLTVRCEVLFVRPLGGPPSRACPTKRNDIAVLRTLRDMPRTDVAKHVGQVIF